MEWFNRYTFFASNFKRIAGAVNKYKNAWAQSNLLDLVGDLG
jgi:hypothetical protein